MSALDLLSRHRPETLVAFGAAGAKTAGDLLEDAAAISRALPAPSPGSHVLLVFEQDRYAMAAAMLGALDRGHALALPPNVRRDTIFAVQSRPETVAVVHDTDAGLEFRVETLLRGDSGPPLAAPIVPHHGVIATVFTSGTTGPMTAWRKTSAELLGEAHVLGRSFEVAEGDRIVATVSPLHIYGLLFSVLLPLARGAAFSRETPHHAEAVAHQVERHEANLLVTVPVQLRALAALRTGALASLRRVVSSTGPLPEDVAAAFRERHGLAVTEVFGSTETGGIAMRMRQGPDAGRSGQDARWRPFEGIKISLGSGRRLRVDSDYLHPDLPRPFETADLVRLHDDGSFTHLGRADGIVKIAGRRVAIPELEECLRRHPSVEDAAVAAIPAPGGRGSALIAAVSPADCDVANLRRVLLERFEPSTLPRRILAVDAIPREENGKLTRDRLLRLFDLRPDGRPVRWDLEWGEPSCEQSEGRARYERPAHLPRDYGWFDGHFEGYPILAGAVQLKELVLPVIAQAFPGLAAVESMSRVKFSGRIEPGADVSVRVERGGDRERVQFEIRQAGEVCSSGLLVFGEGDAP